MKTLSFQTEWLVALVVIYIASVALVKTVLNQDARNSFVVSSQTNVDLFSIKTIIKDLWEPILFVSLLGFSSGTMRAFFQPDNALSSSLIIFFSTLAGVLVFYLFIVLQERSKKATDTLIIKLAVLLGITLLYLSLPFVDQKFWVIYAGVVDLCYVAGSMIMNWLCVKESQDIPVRAIIVLGVFKGTVFLSIALGFIANNTLGMLVQENTTLSFVLSLMGVYIILLTTVVVVLRRLRLALATSNTQNSQILVNMTEDQLRNNKELQDTYGITGREMDVLVLAVAGYNISGIGKQLYISENTVKTYLKRIYTKLDVHSRDDLRTFVTSLTKTA
ncbi:MAG: helix-turn-helix transcriptional regulator [Coriobacteriales bacterium]|nr:helix-turn-helix transcriptional regulator [Coriobacteriales bacterium]